MGATTQRFTGIEVDGRNVQNVLAAFRLIPRIAVDVLTKHAIGRLGPDGTIETEPGAWYALDAWLVAMNDILDRVGPAKMREIGTLVPTYASFPPNITSAAEAMQACDFAYHLNHRKDGTVMFDPATGTLIDGIGHYRFERTDERRGTMTCDDPYYCDFDRGIMIGLGTRFATKTHVTHADGGCRKDGADRCTYLIRW